MGGSSSKETEDGGASIETIIGSAQLAGEGVPHSKYDAVGFFELGVDIDDPIAMCSLADCLMNGWGTNIDPERAYDLYRRAAEEPHNWPPAMHCLALCLRHGIGLDLDSNDSDGSDSSDGSDLDSDSDSESSKNKIKHQKEAFFWFRKATTGINQDVAPIVSIHEVGMCYLHGIGTVVFPKRGVIWLNKSAVLGHEPSQIALRNYYTSIDLSPDAIEILSVAGNKNEAWANTNLGVIATREATKTKKSNNTTQTQVANAVDDKASLFFMPEKSQGVHLGVSEEQQQARDTAQQYFLNALASLSAKSTTTTTTTTIQENDSISDSISGIAEACHNLGVMYIRGWCPGHDKYEGMSLIHRAATAGLADAVSGLATCFQEGHGVNISIPIATRLFKEAAYLGSTEASSQIAKSYRNGTGGVLESPSDAQKWYTMASNRGRPEAQTQLGILLLYGLPDEAPPIKRNPIEAIRLLKLAANAGDPDACRCLSECYEMGVEGVSKQEERNLERRKRRGRTLGIETLRYLQKQSNNPNEKEKEKEKVVLLQANKTEVALAATLAGWKEADDIDREQEKEEQLKERRKLEVAFGWKNKKDLQQEQDEKLVMKVVKESKKEKVPFIIKVDLMKAQKWRERGGKIGDAIRNGDILKVEDGFSFAIAAPMPPIITYQKKKKLKGERKRRKKTSKYVAKVARSQSRSSKSNKKKNSPGIMTPRVGNDMDTDSDDDDEMDAADKKSKKNPRHLPIPPLPLPLHQDNYNTTEGNNQPCWQGPHGPGYIGFGMMRYHTTVSGAQGACIPAAKSSIFPWGGATVSST